MITPVPLLPKLPDVVANNGVVPWASATGLGWPGSPVWLLPGWNVDGAGNGNAAWYSGDLVAAWTNQGSAGGTAVQSNADLYKPKMLKWAQNGRDAALFDANLSYLALTGSSSALAFAHTTGIFEVVVVLRMDNSGVYQFVLGDTDSGTEKGFGLSISSTNYVSTFVCGNPLVVDLEATAVVLTPGVWGVVRVRSNGSTLYASLNGGAESSQAYTGSLGAGDCTRDWAVGRNPRTGSAPFGGLVGFAGVWSAGFTAGQWAALLASLRGYYQI